MISCPICKSKNLQKNGYKLKIVHHRTDAIRNFVFKIKIFKYKCKNCGNTIYEKERFSCPKSSYSYETIFAVLNSLKDLTSNFASVGRTYRLSRKEVMRIFDIYVTDSIKLTKLPEILSFDEKFLNRKIGENGYTFVIIDWLKIKLLDIIHSRHIDTLADYFSKLSLKERLNVKFITMDMYETYLRLAKTYFRNAKVVIDSFHVLQNINRTFNKTRNKFLRKFDNGAENIEDNDIRYYLLKKTNNIICKPYGSLSTKKKANKRFSYKVSERSLVDEVLKLDEEIKHAYNLQQMYYDFNRIKTLEEAQIEIEYLIEAYEDSHLIHFNEMASTLKRWKEYILNSFIRIYDIKRKKYRRLSDGPIEGLNNSLAKIHINGNGYTDLFRFKKIAMFKINKNLPYRF